MINSKDPDGKNSLLLSVEETDILLQKVNKEINDEYFDSNDKQIIKQMVECLGDSRGMVRLGFAEALGAVGEPAIPFLLDALAYHSNPVVRRACAKTLTLIGDPNAIPGLVDALIYDEDTVVKGSSVAALAKTGSASVPILLEILASPEHPESTKGHAAWALAFIGTEAREFLDDARKSKSPEVRAAVVGALAKIAQESQENQEDKDSQDRDNRETQAFEMLIESMEDDSEMVRSEVAAALGNLAYKPAIPHLVKLLAHQNSESRKAAALALMKIGDQVAMDPLQEALAKESEEKIKGIINLAINQIEKNSDDW